MGLSAIEILDIAELVFFSPALIFSSYVMYKHGYRKQLGWRFLLMICLFRLTGAITSLISIHHPSQGLKITYDIMNSLGLSAIISAALGLLDRVNTGMGPASLSARIFQVLHVLTIAGLVLSIIGSVNVFSSNTSNFSTGLDELKAGVCFFSGVFVANVAITGRTLLSISQVQAGERRLLFAVSASLPFTAVRILYSILCFFGNDSKWFSSWSVEWTAVLIHGLMGVLMEAIVVAIFIMAGLMTVRVGELPTRRHEGKVTYNLVGRGV